jgi:hypothetical protein
MINAEFGLHELAIEAALYERQRPRPGRGPATGRGVHHRPRADHRPQGHRAQVMLTDGPGLRWR